MFDFQKLAVYKKAKEFNLEVNRLNPRKIFDSISSDQLCRASWSIPLNIAEGSGRFSNADRKNFFVISRSSVFESVSILENLYDLNKIEKDKYEYFVSLGEEISKILYTMIKNLSK